MPKEYDGPFESQEEEDAAYSRRLRLQERERAEQKVKDEAEELANKGKKKKSDLALLA